MRKIDSNHDGDIDMSEFLTTLLDWNSLQKEQNWQVGGIGRGCTEGLHGLTGASLVLNCLGLWLSDFQCNACWIDCSCCSTKLGGACWDTAQCAHACLLLVFRC